MLKISKKSIELELKEILLKDNDFIKAYREAQKGFKNILKRWFLIGFNCELEYTLDYCFNDGYFNPYLDKQYLDYSNVVIQGKIINLDDIYDYFIYDLENQ